MARMSPPSGLLPLIKCSRPDLILLSSDGQQSYTWRLLLALHSPWVASLLVSSGVTDCGLSCLSLPASHASVQALIASLASPSSQPLPSNEVADLLRSNSDKAERGEKRAEVVNAKPDSRKESFFNEKGTSEQKGESNYFQDSWQEQSSAELKEEMDIEEGDFYDETDHSDLPEPNSFTCESVSEEVKINTDEEVGDHVVEILENVTNTGKTCVTCYVDWKYKFGCRKIKRSWMYFACDNRDGCPAKVVVRKSFSETTGAVSYHALKLMGGAHNHGEQVERVLVDHAKHKLRIIVTEKQEWREKTMKQIYLDFVDSFAANMEEERKSLFSVIFPSYEKMQPIMRNWKVSRTRLERAGKSKNTVHNPKY